MKEGAKLIRNALGSLHAIPYEAPSMMLSFSINRLTVCSLCVVFGASEEQIRCKFDDN